MNKVERYITKTFRDLKKKSLNPKKTIFGTFMIVSPDGKEPHGRIPWFFTLEKRFQSKRDIREALDLSKENVMITYDHYRRMSRSKHKRLVVERGIPCHLLMELPYKCLGR